MPAHDVALVLTALVAVNLAAFLLFWWDKVAAQRRWRRVPERTLLWAAALGGSLGALLAQQVLRHKTRKQPFGNRLIAVLGAQLFLALAGVVAILVHVLTAPVANLHPA
ncbi:MAG: hypothetical protein JWP92_15 [Caulobacter sp.]|nr:hypothetical protein [Caulobacter sp.]